MKTANQLLLFGMVSALSGAAVAADGGTSRAAVDTSKWQCKLCKFEDGLSGAVELGVGNVSEKSSKFGEYTGLNEKGAFVVGDGVARLRGPDAAYWDVNASNLGLSSRAVGMEGGRQGKYRLFLNYDELPHYISDNAQTPFIGTGGASLTLPAGFPAGTTALMPLASTLRPVDLETRRKKLGAGASLIQEGGWEYGVSFRHETRDGTKRTAGAFFVNSAQLVEPVDYVTDQIDAWAAYTGARWQGRLAYYGSKFRNGVDGLTWQNPFAMPGFPGAVAGQLALPPDNQFHQISASVGYQITDGTRASADLAIGRMTQDENFLAPTLNAGLGAPALTGNSLDARAATLNANVKLTSAVTSQLRLNAVYTHDDRDNRTPLAVRPWVTTDMFVALPRINVPYSFTQDRVKLSADYGFSPRLKTSVGYDYDWHERTYQEVDTTREGTIWGKVSSHALDNVDMSLKLAHGERSVSGYQVLPWIDPPENPLLRKYNMAARKRDSAGLRADIAATDTISIGLGIDAAEDKYRDSLIGLTSGREYGLNGDVSVMLTERTSLHVFANHQVIKANQTGSQAFSTPDWRGENKDTINLIGIGVKHAAIKDKLDLGGDFTFTRSRGAMSVDTGAGDPPFPDLYTSLNSLKLYAVYRIKDNLSLHGGYWYERYRSENWTLAGVTPATIPNVLTFGEQPPQYHVHVIRVSLRYKF